MADPHSPAARAIAAARAAGASGRHSHVLTEDGANTPDRPWIFRTYAGHSSARASNQLFRQNLAHGQTGLSIAFDLPTQCGYSSDHPLARPEIGKVGVPVNSLDDLHVLFDGIELRAANTSMTINGTAMWLLALYLALARERGIDERSLRGTTQNDIIKEYLARGTYIFPPEASLRLTAEMYEYCLDRVPQWNPSNVCSYHLQEAGATPEQELAFSLSTAIGLLDLLRERGRLDAGQFARAVGRISFFVNAGIRFVEETCKMRAFVELWDEITRERYGIADPELRRFRYGVQVNSLNLTEQQPENNAWRILIECLGVLLSRDARCRALQLPCWNEALSLPRPWDQQWSLRLQQILAYETDLLEYPDLFDGSPVVASKVEALAAAARREIDRILAMGGVRAAVEGGHMKSELVRSMAQRVARIATGEQVVVGVNRWTDGLPSPLLAGDDSGMFRPPRELADEALAALAAVRARRDGDRVRAALDELRAAATRGDNLMEPSIACALARVTTGEWADALRQVFGEYRAATGVDGQALPLDGARMAGLRERVERLCEARGRRPRVVIGKPGLDGHSNGAEIIAVSARDAGLDVIYAGIRLSPAEIVASAVEEGADLLGLSILSGSHMELVDEVMALLEKAGAARDIAVVVGGIVPPADAEALLARGVRRVFTPADYQIGDVVERIVDLVEGRA
ncbi:MAG TPA: protein meaA [Kofleriaceae bacterium]|nr:protein meaA [Kofleriaceae bacterium]